MGGARLAALRRVRPAELALFVRIVAVAVAVPGLARLPLSRLERVLEPRRPTCPDVTRWEAVPRLVDAAMLALAPVVRPGCLTRGITSYRFLRRAGLDVSLCFGIGEVEGRDEGHCWLVRDDEPYLEKVDPRGVFVPMTCLPSSRAKPSW